MKLAMTLGELVATVSDFNNWNYAEKIRFFAWFLHTHRNVDEFQPADVRACFDILNIDPPSSISSFLAAMVKRRPREALYGSGYRLEKRVREQYDEKFGKRVATAQLHKLLEALPPRISATAARTYLVETLVCLRHGAFRAAVVMAWNLAFDHVCNWILSRHLAAFNAQLPLSFPKAPLHTIAVRDDFSELKEFQVLQVARSAGFLSQAAHKILREKLARRNLCAHPSTAVVTQLTAEDCIIDLMENVVLALS